MFPVAELLWGNHWRSQKANRLKQLPCCGYDSETLFMRLIPDHEKVFPQTETDPINELLLFYDPTSLRKR